MAKNANGRTKVKSVQVTNIDPQPISSHIFPITFFGGSDIAPGWDAGDRDWWLRNFWKKFGNDLLQAFLAASVAKVVTQNWTLEGPENKVKLYHRLLRDGYDFGKGYDHGIARGVIDYYTQDNGWFIERQRASMADHTGPCLGLSHLDSQRMRPSGNDEFPYYYEDVYGQYHLMHRSQYIRIVDMPDSATELYSEERGFCALSRALSTAMILSLLVTMKREKLSDLPPSAIAVFNNINRKQFENALTLQGLNEDNSGSVVWRSVMPLFGIDPAHPATLDFISFREVWEGFDERSAWDIAAYSFAAAWRMDVREVWPASQGPLGTGKEAEVQHQKAKSKSTGLLFTNLERALNHDWTLPEDVKFKFMIQDIDEEEQRTAVHKLQIENIKTMQDAGAALTADEVRFLLIQQKILPRGFESAPAEGATINFGNVPVYIDDVERASKEFWGPTVIVDADGTKTYIEQGFTWGFKGGPGSGHRGHGGRLGKVGGSAPKASGVVGGWSEIIHDFTDVQSKTLIGMLNNSKIPEEHIGAVGGIYGSPEPRYTNWKDATAQFSMRGLHGVQMYANMGTGTIHVLSKNFFVDRVMVHEIGHIIHTKLMPSSESSLRSAYDKIFTKKRNFTAATKRKLGRYGRPLRNPESYKEVGEDSAFREFVADVYSAVYGSWNADDESQSQMVKFQEFFDVSLNDIFELEQ